MAKWRSVDRRSRQVLLFGLLLLSLLTAIGSVGEQWRAQKASHEALLDHYSWLQQYRRALQALGSDIPDITGVYELSGYQTLLQELALQQGLALRVNEAGGQLEIAITNSGQAQLLQFIGAVTEQGGRFSALQLTRDQQPDRFNLSAVAVLP